MSVTAFRRAARLLAVALVATGPLTTGSRPAAGTVPDREVIAGEFIVGWQPGTDAAQRQAVRGALGLSSDGLLDGDRTELVRGPGAPAAVAAALAHSPHVAYAEPNHPLEVAADPYLRYQWGLHNDGVTASDGIERKADVDIDAPEAWLTASGSPATVVAVIDTGVKITHPDLAPVLWTNPGEAGGAPGVDDDGNGFVDDLHGWDFHDDDASLYDSATDDFHGTHVAGVIAAADNGIGTVGVAPGVRVMVLKTLGPDGGTTADAVRAIAYAVGHGARVINASWGGDQDSRALFEAIRDADAVVVAAAGNDSRDIDVEPVFPAAYALPNLLAVAAVTPTGQLADFSNWGVATVDVAAPGAAVLGPLPDGYGYLSGTSSAAPHVAGVAALVADRHPDATSAQVADVVRASAAPLSSVSAKTTTGGLVNAAAATRRSPAATEPVCDVATAAISFTDVAASSPHLAGILCTAAWGVTHGTTDTTYGPTRDVTRGQMAAFLARILGLGGYDAGTPPDAFTDDDGTLHEADIDIAAAAGIVLGDGSGTVRPRASVSRAQMASFLVRTHDVLTASVTIASRDHFADDDGSPHEAAINAAAELGLTAGRIDGTYDGRAPVLRSQMATFLARLLHVLVEAAAVTPV